METEKSKLQSVANEFFSKLGNSRMQVSIQIINGHKMFAGARGLKLFNIPLGQIFISRSLLEKLSEDEVNFVIAHEVVHIDQNHLPATILLKLPKDIIDALGKVDLRALGLSLLWDFVKLWIRFQGGLPPEAAITKQQELQADVWAIFLTGNKTAAINCLKKLVNNNLESPSHLWEVFDVKLPIMTMRERINDVLVTLSYYERRGYTFV
jgi:Zn-dependent protease with chaperone function